MFISSLKIIAYKRTHHDLPPLSNEKKRNRKRGKKKETCKNKEVRLFFSSARMIKNFG